jgi:uncharacterized protein YaeQ
MAQGTVLYRFRLNVSDVDRSFYEKLDFRIALHPSESVSFLLTRTIAYALNAGNGVSFSAKGLADPDEPCISSDSPMGGKELWIEVGNPSARRLHKAAKAANRVKVYTYKNVELLLKELRTEEVHKRDAIEIYTLDSQLLNELEQALERDNEWEIFRDQGTLLVSMRGESHAGELAGPFFAK